MTDSFFQKVYNVTKLVPHGRVTTYGAIARFIGSPQSSRMVGWALNNCHHLEEFIPAHRVVNRNGMLSGKHHFGNPSIMQQLLENEGVEITNDHIVNFDKLFWNPSVELK
ncbi:MAG TPA: MGMT family protein [Bacteroidales bacterium]|nr:MGMT family protein [Bacteroidales bacterium]